MNFKFQTTASQSRPSDAGPGSFWTWREQMYALAGRLDPDTYLALARATFAEMVLAGITAGTLSEQELLELTGLSAEERLRIGPPWSASR